MKEVFVGFSGLKFRLLLIAIFAVVFGLAWNVAREGSRGISDVGIETVSAASSAGSDRRLADAMQLIDPWAAAGVATGISFILAILVGSLMRVSFKKMIALLVVVVGVVLVLDYKGLVEPFWSEYLLSMPEFKEKLLTQTESTKAFLKGHFPPFASAVAGFGFGLKR